ncbi:hypothetical protein BXY64_0249 [Marinifilum flexuosum]|uniref:Uncharacterized protein n=1 Tax=Marinifilum flexuosum TaxID=1117708 RepID=A0A419X6A0_9BACT|nr:hypothetical protein BXY64_0249 [Marinifilum flexuosum]
MYFILLSINYGKLQGFLKYQNELPIYFYTFVRIT